MSYQKLNGSQFQKGHSRKKYLKGAQLLTEEFPQNEQIFLRSDVNQLFDNMMISSNFNLKKYSENRQVQDKNQSKKQSFERKIQNATGNQFKKTITEPSQPQKINNSFLNRKKKLQAQIQLGSQPRSPKRQHLNTQNLNKLLRKKESIILANVKTGKNTMQATSTNFRTQQAASQSQEQQKLMSLTSTKQIYHAKNLRRKVMSLTSKGERMHQQKERIDSQTFTNNEKKLSIKLSKRQEWQGQQATQTKLNINQKQQVQNPRGNNYKQLQKKHNKGGPLKFKHVENWLNNIIQEYCHDEYFDTSLQSAALKKYYIDSNSLMSNGVDPADVNRIYNSLFVYSIGFNNLIKDISRGNRELVKNIWKVYSLLLEYCAAGNYETLVGEIQRDKLRKVEELKVQIQRRQQIIQKNQQLNEQKNMGMYKQLKRLKDQNTNLANQRQILMQDFQQADQAFNQQVSLRLKFQNTINQIYGVHKQLQNKHGRLFHDFETKMQELKRQSEKYFEQTKTSQKYKYELIDVREKLNEMSKINAHDKEHIDVLLLELEKMKENYFGTLKELEQTKYLNVEKERKMEQMTTELNNNKIILEMREKSAKQTHAQYQITLEENNKLFNIISQQRVEMQVLLKEKKEFNQNVLKILADSSYYKKKHQSSQSLIKSLNQKVSQCQLALHKQQIQSDIYIKQIESYKNDLESNYANIKKMHEKNFQLEEELSYLRKYEGNMDQMLQQKNQSIQQLKDKCDQLQGALMQETNQFRTLESKYKILETQFRAQKELNLRRVEDFRKQQDKMFTNESSLSKMLNITNIELDKFKNLFNNTLMDLKNQKFERSNLTLNYEQILKVLQKKNADEKQMAIKINELEEEVLEYKEKYKLTHLNLVNTTEELTGKINTLNHKISQQKIQIDHKVHFYHPMVFQDLYHAYSRQIEMHYRTKELYQEKLAKIKQEKAQVERNMKRQKAQFEFQTDKKEKEFKKIEDKLRTQLQFQRDQSAKMKKRLSQLQILQATYKQKVSIYQNKQTDEKRLQQLLNEVREKGKTIASLYEQIQKIHDLKRDEILSLEKKIKQVEDQKMNFVYQFKTKKERQIKEELDKKYKEEIDRIKAEYEEKAYKSTRFKKPNADGKNSSNQNEDSEAFFKDYIKNKTLEELLKIKKEQFQQSNEQQNNRFFDQVEIFFKNSFNPQNQQFFNRTNFFGSKNTTQKDFNKTISKATNEKIPIYLQRLQSEQSRRKASISRKIKNAYDYYAK